MNELIGVFFNTAVILPIPLCVEHLTLLYVLHGPCIIRKLFIIDNNNKIHTQFVTTFTKYS